jgi:glutaredoxin
LIRKKKGNNLYYVIGKQDCPSCDKAKALLEDSGYYYIYEELTERSLKLLKSMNIKTVPAIFEFNGGYEELQKELNND